VKPNRAFDEGIVRSSGVEFGEGRRDVAEVVVVAVGFGVERAELGPEMGRGGFACAMVAAPGDEAGWEI
jgi:hypothetical protein